MATITNTNDPNRDPNKPVTLSTGNVTPQQAVSSGASANAAPSASSGQYSTLQKYLGANQNAGQRVASQIGANLDNQSQGLATTATRENSEAAGANAAFQGNIGQANTFTNQLNTPATTASVSNPATKAYDVNSYSTNLSGQQAAKDIAANSDQLSQLRGLATGDTLAKNKAASDKEAKEAVNATTAEIKKNQQSQENVNTESGRTQLLDQLFNSNNNYRQGLKQLDQAFLQNDKSNTLNQISNNLKTNVGNIQNRVNSANTLQTSIKDLMDQGQLASTGLQARTDDLNSQYDKALSDRVSTINSAKGAFLGNNILDANGRPLDRNSQAYKNAYAQSLMGQYDRLRDTNSATQDFANLLQLDKVGQVNDGRAVNNWIPSQADTSGISLFNIVKDRGNLKDFVDTSLLESQADGLSTANKQDVENLQALRALSGSTKSIPQESIFQGNQLGESSLDEALNDRLQTFKDKDLNQRYRQETSGQEDVIRGNGLWQDTVGTAYGAAGADATLADYLYGGGIGRSVSGSFNDSGIGDLFNTRSGTNTTTPYTYLSPNERLGIVTDPNNIYGLPAQNANYWETFNQANAAEDRAVSGVNSQIQNAITDSGYKNLLRILQG